MTTTDTTTRGRMEAWFYAEPEGNKGTRKEIAKVLGATESRVSDVLADMLHEGLAVVVEKRWPEKNSGQRRRYVYGPNPAKLGVHKPCVHPEAAPNVPLVRQALAAQHPLFHAWIRRPEQRA